MDLLKRIVTVIFYMAATGVGIIFLIFLIVVHPGILAIVGILGLFYILVSKV